MKELFDKISSYNIFNYLLPGILYAVAISEFTRLNLLQDDIVIGLFLYYFIGLIISRIGSFVVEPVFRKLKVLKITSYSEFLAASEKDKKIETLSESNNMYRTLIALFLTFFLTKLYLFLVQNFQWIGDEAVYILATLLLFIFILSYRKQSKYIAKRIHLYSGKEE